MRSLLLTATALAAALATPRVGAQALPQLSGTLVSLVGELTSPEYLLRAPTEDRRRYADPTDALRDARRAAASLAIGDTAAAAAAAGRIGYELVDFFDTANDSHYLVLREDLAAREEPRGWGAYLFNPDATIDAIVEAPHPLGDSNTAPIAARVFAAGARGLLIAGAHRKQADLPDLTGSVFHQVHTAWIGPGGGTASLQVHGFAAYKHPFPEGAEVVLSTGGGGVPALLQRLDGRLDAAGFPSYVYNHLTGNAPGNRLVNGDSPGERFRSLAATKNLQGRFARGIGGAFVHLELEYGVRHDAERSAAAADIVGRVLAAVAPITTRSVAPSPESPPPTESQPPPLLAGATPQAAADRPPTAPPIKLPLANAAVGL